MTSSEQYLRSQQDGLGVVKRAGYGRAMTLEQWAKAQAERLIAPLGDRWNHVQAVADKARRVGAVLPAEDADLLVAAALLHDVGYAPSLNRLGFHAVDGARFLRAQGQERLARLLLQPQFSALLLVVGASSGGLMASSPERPGERERRIDWWAPDQAGQQPTQLGDGERDQHAQRGHHDHPPSPSSASGRRARVTARNASATMARVTCRYQAGYWRTW